MLYDIIIIARRAATSWLSFKPIIARQLLRTKVAILAQDRRDCLGQLLRGGYGIDNIAGAADARLWLGHGRAACPEGARSLLDESAPARAPIAAWCTSGVELAFGGARHRIDARGRSRAVMIYGQTEVTLD